MDEKQFRKHLADLAHGHHHPEEHDWNEGTAKEPTSIAPGKPAPAAGAAKPKVARKRSRKK
jgi:hypothetical protein